MPLPPVSPDRMICRASPLYTWEQGGQMSSRRLPHGRRSTPPGSLSVSYRLALSPVVRSIASIRPCRRTGLAQLPVAASCCSQRAKSSPAARASSSPACAGSGLSSVMLSAAARTVMEPGPHAATAPCARRGRVLHRQRTRLDLPSGVEACRRRSSDGGCPRCDGHRTGDCACCAAGQLASERAVPARREIRLPPPTVGHQPGGQAKQRQIEPLAVAQIGHIIEDSSPYRQSEPDAQGHKSEPGSRVKASVWLGRTTAKCR